MSPPDPIALVVVQGSSDSVRCGKRILVVSEAILGRSPSADIPIPDLRVSRRHARFFIEGEQWWVEDAGSTSGIWHNKARVSTRAPINPGDWLQVGGVMLRIDAAQIETVPVAGPMTITPRRGALVHLLAEQAFLGDQPLALRPLPLQALGALVANAGIWVSFDTLAAHIWTEEDFADVAYVNKYVSYVRRAMLVAVEANPTLIDEIHLAIETHADSYTDTEVGKDDPKRLLREFVKARRKVGYRLHQAP